MLSTMKENTPEERKEEMREKCWEYCEGYEGLLGLCVDMSFLLDNSGNILYVAPSCKQILGYTQKEMMADKFNYFELVHPDDFKKATNFSVEFSEGGLPGTRDTEFRLIRKDGKTIWVSASLKIVKDKAGKLLGTQGVLRDITQRKQLEESFIENSKAAAIGELAAELCHELNNPLAALLGNAQLLLQELPDTNPHRIDIEKILSGARRLKKVTDLLGELSRKEYAFQLGNINDLVEEALNTVEEGSPTNGFNIIKKYAPNLPRIKVSSAHLKKVFLNLALNARKSMPKGGTLKVTTNSEGNRVKIVFERAGISRYPDLWIAHARDVSKKHQGTFVVQSKDSETTYIMRLPVNEGG